MLAMLVDGPNQGVVTIHRDGNILKALDPSEHVASYKLDEGDPLRPLKINTYYRLPMHPYAFENGFSALYKFHSSSC